MPESPNAHRTPDELSRVGRTGADSVFRYVEHAAERLDDGTVRWRARDDAGNAQYRGDLYSNGGIPLFLADYYRVTGDSRALELGTAGAAWCAAPVRRFIGDLWTNSTDAVTDENLGLIGGRTGLGLAWLRLHAVSGDAALLERAATIAERLIARPPGPLADYSGGAAGHGIFLLRLWEHTNDPAHLAAAVTRAAWLESVATPHQRAEGLVWRLSTNPNSPARTPLYAGVAGVGYFLLLLYEKSRDEQWAALARGAAATLIHEARPDRGGLNWLPEMGAAHDVDLDWKRVPIGREFVRCQWCNGAPGVGLFFAKAYETLGDTRYLEVAEGAGEATYAYGDGRANPTYCHGLAGNTELLIELARVAPSVPVYPGRAAVWRERALEFGRRLLAYRREGSDGVWWPSDDTQLDAPDFLCGAAGTGHVFLRLLGLAGSQPIGMALL